MGIGDGKSRFSFLVDERSEETCLFFIWRLDNLVQDKVLDSGRGFRGHGSLGAETDKDKRLFSQLLWRERV